MSRLYNLSCPDCGGTLAGLGRARVVACRYCGRRMLVLAERFVARYALPAVAKRRAVESLKEMLRHPDLPKDFSLSVKMRESTLYYVPVWEFYGRRLGTRVMLDRRERRDGSVTVTPDTEVHLGDFSRYLPAAPIEHWGLEHATLFRKGSLPQASLEAFDEAALSKLATVLSPQIATDDVAKQFTSPDLLSALTMDDQVEIVETRFSLIYHPVWVFRYEFMGKIYGVYVDGTDGTVLQGRAPRREERRVIALLAIVGALAFPAAKMLRALASMIHDPALFLQALFTPMGLFFAGSAALFGTAVGMAILALGWNAFRFSQEFTFFPGGPSVHYIGKPSETWAEKWLDRVSGMLDKMFEDALRKKDNEAVGWTVRISFKPWSRR